MTTEPSKPRPFDWDEITYTFGGRSMYYDYATEPCTMHTWADLWQDFYGRCVGTTIVGDVMVSTVWLGLDHSWAMDGPPLIFETMVFGAPEGSEWDDFQFRYSTWEQAARGHAEICSQVFRDVPLKELTAGEAKEQSD